MLMLNGQVLNVFKTKIGERNGETFGGDDKVQVLVGQPMADGTIKNQIIDLRCKDISQFKDRQSFDVSIPVGAFAPAKGNVVYFMTGDPVFEKLSDLTA